MSATEVEPEFERLLAYLKGQRGFDFTGYKRASLRRRFHKRMEGVSVQGFAEYVDYLEVHPDEFVHLFNTVLINVTEFFRDPEAWEALRREHIPQMLAKKPAGEPIRVWTAACASGEEAYSLLIALVEELGEEEVRERVKIYATDVDEHALGQARRASYRPKALEGLTPELREKYFQEVAGQQVFRADLRRYVIFGRHDLVNDAPISNLDLLTCRNTLMYFNSETQARLLARFHFALRSGGLLFLGRAEMMRSHHDLFVPLDLKARIFARSVRHRPRESLGAIGPVERSLPSEPTNRGIRLRDAALDAQPVAQLVVDAAGMVVLVNLQARLLFGLSEGDVGRPLKDLRISYFPFELRSLVEKSYAERAPVHAAGVSAQLPDLQEYTLDVQVSPLRESGGIVVGASITFTDITRYRQLQAELQNSTQELETAYEELQATNEELETTNEELQSAVEELETTNEELQSTNEELETMNEELQSTNEELETINDELRQRSVELSIVSTDLESILRSVRVGVVVLNPDQSVRIWSRKAEDLWGVQAEEVVGRELTQQDVGFPIERLGVMVRACLETESGYEETVLDALNRRGRSIRCRVSCSPLRQSTEIRGVVILMEEWVEAPR